VEFKDLTERKREFRIIARKNDENQMGWKPNSSTLLSNWFAKKRSIITKKKKGGKIKKNKS
jgi:hypothetical protein